MSEYPQRYRLALVRESDLPAAPTLQAPAEAARFLMRWTEAAHCDDAREHFGLLLMDSRHALIGLVEVSVGCLTGSLVHPREVFAPAILAPAVALTLWHTHPSGNPEPSPEDLALTRRLAAAGALLGIEVLDHVVLGMGTGHWVSMKDRGML